MPFRDTQDLLPEECIDDSAWQNTFDQRRTLMNDYNSIFKHEPDGAQTCLVSIDAQNLWPRDGELCTEWRLFIADLIRAQPDAGATKDRHASDPGGCECHTCGATFIGEEWHVECGVCSAKKQPPKSTQIVQQAAKASFPPFPSPDQNKSPEPIVRQYSRRVG